MDLNDLPRISIAGLGKLGSPLAAVLAAKGFPVIGLDLNERYVDAINAGVAPVQEPRLQEFIDRGRANLRATTSYDAAISNSDLTFVVVPTPSDKEEMFTNKYVVEAVNSIGRSLRQKSTRHVVAITSTVMPSATGGAIKDALESASDRAVGPLLGLAYNPEFIALGSVIKDMLEPDFILIGESDRDTGDLLQRIYTLVCENKPLVKRMNFVNAEMAKIAVNTFVTTKISYANMLAEMCDKLPGADVDVVTAAIGSDTRIGNRYLRGAIGYGGPCFPRDNKAFAALGRKIGARCDIAEATDRINDRQIERLVAAIRPAVSAGARVTLLGLSYKPDTEVIEESQGVALARYLSSEGYLVTTYDPLATPAAETALADRVHFASSLSKAIANADAIVITTPWPEFKELPFDEAFVSERSLVVIDPWRIVNVSMLPKGANIIYLGQGARSGARQRQLRVVAKSS